MINAHIQIPEEQYKVEIDGPEVLLAAETGVLIYLIHRQLLAQDPEIAEAYRRSIQKLAHDDSPVWGLRDARSDAEGAQI